MLSPLQANSRALVLLHRWRCRCGIKTHAESRVFYKERRFVFWYGFKKVSASCCCVFKRLIDHTRIIHRTHRKTVIEPPREWTVNGGGNWGSQNRVRYFSMSERGGIQQRTGVPSPHLHPSKSVTIPSNRPVQMNLFATWEIDSSSPSCVPRYVASVMLVNIELLYNRVYSDHSALLHIARQNCILKKKTQLSPSLFCLHKNKYKSDIVTLSLLLSCVVVRLHDQKHSCF